MRSHCVVPTMLMTWYTIRKWPGPAELGSVHPPAKPGHSNPGPRGPGPDSGQSNWRSSLSIRQRGRDASRTWAISIYKITVIMDSLLRRPTTPRLGHARPLLYFLSVPSNEWLNLKLWLGFGRKSVSQKGLSGCRRHIARFATPRRNAGCTSILYPNHDTSTRSADNFRVRQIYYYLVRK